MTRFILLLGFAYLLINDVTLSDLFDGLCRVSNQLDAHRRSELLEECRKAPPHEVVYRYVRNLIRG